VSGERKVRHNAALISDCHPSPSMETSRGVTTDDVSGCVIVTGMPGAGKTTITSLVAGLMPRAAQVGGDAVNVMIRSGFVWFMGQPTEEALRQDELCNRNMCCLANNFIDFGFTVLMDTVLADRSELDFFIALMSRVHSGLSSSNQESKCASTATPDATRRPGSSSTGTNDLRQT
jgi:energy-coupling factor transporter ATP-binding protein EcfA2